MRYVFWRNFLAPFFTYFICIINSFFIIKKSIRKSALFHRIHFNGCKLGSIDRVIIFDSFCSLESAILAVSFPPSHRVYKVCPASSNGLLPWPSWARSVSDPVSWLWLRFIVKVISTIVVRSVARKIWRKESRFF